MEGKVIIVSSNLDPSGQDERGLKNRVFLREEGEQIFYKTKGALPEGNAPIQYRETGNSVSL